MKIAIKILLPIFLLAGLLTSCSGSAPGPIPTAVMGTATSTAGTEFVKTQVVIAEATPTIPNMLIATPVPDPNDLIPPAAGEQVYIDPDGWYSVNFPAGMKSFNKPNLFNGQEDFLESGYLPNMGYVPKALDVCIWLANFALKPEQSLIVSLNLSIYYYKNACSAITMPGNWQIINYYIYENPYGDPEHRFVYVKTDLQYLRSFTFSWLTHPSGPKPATTLTASSSGQVSFWDNMSPMPPGISVAEYTQQPTGNDDKFHFVPTQAWPTPKLEDNDSLPQKTTLEKLGYKLGPTPTSGEAPRFPNLYRDGRLLLEHVQHISPVYTFSTASGPLTALVVRVDNGKSWEDFVIQNDAITDIWPCSGIDDEYPPLLYQGELLWAKVTQDAHIVIKKSNGDIVFTFTTHYEAFLPQFKFRVWNDHWVLEADGYVIQDGEVINQEKNFNFDKIFGRNLIHDKPVYFFRKDGKVGISYGGQILPLHYDDVSYDDAVPSVPCCDNAQHTPYFSIDSILFYAYEKDTGWRYVVVKFNDAGVGK